MREYLLVLALVKYQAKDKHTSSYNSAGSFSKPDGERGKVEAMSTSYK